MVRTVESRANDSAETIATYQAKFALEEQLIVGMGMFAPMGKIRIARSLTAENAGFLVRRQSS
jgi:hypothetical protein